MGIIGRKKANRSDQIGQLNALRLKTTMKSKNLSRGKSRKFGETKCMVRGRNSEGVPITNMAMPLGKLELAQLGNMGILGNSFFGDTVWRILSLGGDLRTPWKINQFRPAIPKQELTLMKVEN